MTDSSDRVVAAVLRAEGAQPLELLRASDRLPAGGGIKVDDGDDVLVAPHIAFVLEQPLGPSATVEDASAATRGVTAAIAIVGEGGVRFMSASSMTPVAGVELRTLGVIVEDGVDVVESGAGAAASGDPLQAIVNAAAALEDAGISRGFVVLSGPLTNAVRLRPGRHVAATFAHLGRIAVQTNAL